MSLFGHYDALLGFEASYYARRVIHFLPVEPHRQVAIVYQLHKLGAILALTMLDCLSNARIDLAQLNRVPIQIHLGLLDFSDDLEVLGFCSTYHHLKILLETFLIHAITQQFDSDFLVRRQSSIAHIEGHRVAATSLHRLAHNDACSARFALCLLRLPLLGLFQGYVVLPGQFLIFGTLDHEGCRDRTLILDRKFGTFLRVDLKQAKIDDRLTQFENGSPKDGLTAETDRGSVLNFKEKVGETFATLLTFNSELHVNGVNGKFTLQNLIFQPNGLALQAKLAGESLTIFALHAQLVLDHAGRELLQLHSFGVLLANERVTFENGNGRGHLHLA